MSLHSPTITFPLSRVLVSSPSSRILFHSPRVTSPKSSCRFILFARDFHGSRRECNVRREIYTPRKMQYCLAFYKHPLNFTTITAAAAAAAGHSLPSLLISIRFHVFLSPRFHRILDVMRARTYEISKRASCAENTINP